MLLKPEMSQRQRGHGQHQHQPVGHEFPGLGQPQGEENQQPRQNNVRDVWLENHADSAEYQRSGKGNGGNQRRFAAGLEKADQAAGHQ